MLPGGRGGVRFAAVAGRTIFRWQGVQFFSSACAPADPSLLINFEIELNSDGSIRTRYGSGNIDLFPVVGIAGGDRDPYVQNALTSEASPITLTNAQTGVFTPRTQRLYRPFNSILWYLLARVLAGRLSLSRVLATQEYHPQSILPAMTVRRFRTRTTPFPPNADV